MLPARAARLPASRRNLPPLTNIRVAQNLYSTSSSTAVFSPRRMPDDDAQLYSNTTSPNSSVLQGTMGLGTRDTRQPLTLLQTTHGMCLCYTAVDCRQAEPLFSHSPDGVVHRGRHQPPRVRGEAHVRQVVGVPLQPPHELPGSQVVQPNHLVVARQGHEVRIAYLEKRREKYQG